MKENILNNKGFTLLETIISVAIIGMVLTLAFSLLVFGQNNFNSSNKQYEIQNDGRITTTYLSKEIRYATDLEIIDAAQAESQISSGEEYSYFLIKDGKLHNYIYESGTYKQITFGSALSNSESKFEKINDETIRILIKSIKDNKDYDLDTEIILDNLKLSDINISGSSGNAVRYKTEYIESSNDDDEDEDDSNISIGSESRILKSGETGSITFEVTTANITNGEFLDVYFNESYAGLALTNNQIQVSSDKASVEVNSYTSVTAGDYLFFVEYDNIKRNKIFKVIDAENSYTVIFDSNGGDGSYSETALVDEGETLNTLPPNPTYSGHNFNGWNTAADGSGDGFDTSDVVDGDMTVYAQWEVMTTSDHTVTFVNGTGNILKTETVAHGGNATAPAEPLRIGYNFNGWDILFNNVTSDLTVTAQWEAKTYTITFDKNNPKATNPSPLNKTVIYDSTYGSLPTVSLKNKEFKGWYTDKNHGTEIEPGAKVSITGNITLYAHWDN